MYKIWIAYKGVGRKFFRGGPIIEPVLTPKNGIFEIWEVVERLWKSRGGMAPLADAHDRLWLQRKNDVI